MGRVYLCGPITSDPDTWSWRKRASTYFEDRNIKALDPLRGKDLQSIKGLGYESNIPGWVYVARDFKDLKISDIILCNMTKIPPRQCIGSLMELGFAVAKDIPFIIATEEDEFLQHPFITENALQVVPDLETGMQSVEFILS